MRGEILWDIFVRHKQFPGMTGFFYGILLFFLFTFKPLKAISKCPGRLVMFQRVSAGKSQTEQKLELARHSIKCIRYHCFVALENML